MAKKSSKKDSNKKGNKKSDSKKQKEKIDEKDKRFMISLISVLVILAVVVLVVYSQTGPYKTGSKNLTECPPGSGNVDICTSEYAPVCGYSSDKSQINSYPNDCHACKNKNVEYFKEGRC